MPATNVALKRAEAAGRVRLHEPRHAPGDDPTSFGQASAPANAWHNPAPRVYQPNLVEPTRRDAYGRRIVATPKSSLADRTTDDAAAASLFRSSGTPEAERRLAWQSRWLGSEDIRAEFSACDDYVAYMESLGVKGRSLLR